MLSENRVGSANHHGLFHAISVDRQAPVRLFRAMQGSSEMDGQLVSVCSCFLDCHCRSRGGDVSRIQGPCLLCWDPKAETATKYSRMWSSRVRSSWPSLPPSLLKSGGTPKGLWGSDPPGTKAFSVSQAKLPLPPRLWEAPPHRGPRLSPSSQRTASGRPPLSRFCPGREFPGSSRSAPFPRTATKQAKKPESAPGRGPGRRARRAG